jgi:Reverse transcriptase (RNA-dependent DNA polymerase)
MNCDVYACFIDYQRAFDNVQHEKLANILKRIGIDDRDLRIIMNLYWNQTASVRVDGENTEEVTIQRGVRQGCVLSPLLFNLYSEEIFREALDGQHEGILVNGECLNNIRYADDTVVFADSLQSLQDMMNRVTKKSEEYGLRLNTAKTKYMVISKEVIPPGRLTVNNKQIERVNKYKYLGTTVGEQWDHSLEIKCRIEQARATFVKMSSLFRSHDLSVSTKMRVVRCYVFPVLLYGAEAWTLTEASSKKLEAFEMWIYRRMLRISWVQHVTNRDVLRRMDKETEILKTVKIRKLEYLGHIMRNAKRYELPQLVLQGKVLGKRGPGRRRISWLKNLRTWFGASTTGLFRAAADKVRIAMMVANIR